MEKIRRSFNNAAEFFLCLTILIITMTIVNGFIQVSNYKALGLGIPDSFISVTIVNILIIVSAVFTLMKKKAGLIALLFLFILRLFGTIPSGTNVSTAAYLGANTATLLRDIGPFAIAMCFKKNGISGWKSMLASEEYVAKHTKTPEVPPEPTKKQEDDAVIKEEGTEKIMPMVEKNVSLSSVGEPANEDEVLTSSSIVDNPTISEQSFREIIVNKEKPFPTKSVKQLPKGVIIGIASIIFAIVVCSIITAIVALKSYPDYISSFSDKWNSTFNLPNEDLVKRLMNKAQPKGDGVYYVFTYPTYTSTAFDADRFYRNRVDALREYPGCTLYMTTREIKDPEELDDNELYVSLKEGTLGVLEESKDIIETKEYWIKNKSLAGERIFATQKYDSEATIRDEMSIIDEAASIPVKDIDVVELVGGYYERECNFSKASDYYQFLLKKYPHNAAIKGRLAYSLCMAGNNEEAKAAAENALKKDPKEVRALSALALVEAEEFNWGEVKKYARKAIDYGSEESNVFFAYCEALYKQGEVKAAQQYYNKAYELYRHNPRRDKYTDYAGCPFEVLAFHFGFCNSNGDIITPYDNKLISSNSRYITTILDVNFERYDDAEIKVKILQDGKLSTGTGSKDGYSYSGVINGIEPGKYSVGCGTWGNDTPGNWRAGNYEVQIWYKDEMIGSDTFRIY